LSIIENIPEGYDTFTSIAGLDKECINHTEGATVKFLVFTQYPAGSPPEDSVLVSLKIDQLGIEGTCKVRDLWAKEDIGEYTNEFSIYVRKHGAKLLKITEVK
jgi:alpha-galactosidase